MVLNHCTTAPTGSARTISTRSIPKLITIKSDVVGHTHEGVAGHVVELGFEGAEPSFDHLPCGIWMQCVAFHLSEQA